MRLLQVFGLLQHIVVGCRFEEDMLVLFETPAGFALFKVLDEGKLDKVEVSGCCCLLPLFHLLSFGFVWVC